MEPLIHFGYPLVGYRRGNSAPESAQWLKPKVLEPWEGLSKHLLIWLLFVCIALQSFLMRKHFFNNEQTGFFKTQNRDPVMKNPMTGEGGTLLSVPTHLANTFSLIYRLFVLKCVIGKLSEWETAVWCYSWESWWRLQTIIHWLICAYFLINSFQFVDSHCFGMMSRSPL